MCLVKWHDAFISSAFGVATMRSIADVFSLRGVHVFSVEYVFSLYMTRRRQFCIWRRHSA